jgi:hypothetical protein
LSLIFIFYLLVAFLSGKLGYPSYILSIAIHQFFYMSCLILLGPIGVWRSLRTVVWVNIAAVAIQIYGTILGNDALVQLNFLGIDKGSSFEYLGFLPRVSGLATEPAHLSYIMLPILLIALIGRQNIPAEMSKGRSLILACYLLTFSLVAYLQLFFSMLLINIRRIHLKSIFLISLISVIIGSLMINTHFIKDRIDSAIFAISGENTNSTSIFAIQSNILVALSSLSESPLLGNGLTSHRVTYEATIEDVINYKIDETWRSLNSNDASSLILLIISEAGLLGLVLFLGFLKRAIHILSRCEGQFAMLGFVHAVTLAVVGLRYGQWASPFIMLNLQVVLFVLAASALKDNKNKNLHTGRFS